MNNPAQSYTTY